MNSDKIIQFSPQFYPQRKTLSAGLISFQDAWFPQHLFTRIEIYPVA